METSTKEPLVPADVGDKFMGAVALELDGVEAGYRREIADLFLRGEPIFEGMPVGDSVVRLEDVRALQKAGELFELVFSEKPWSRPPEREDEDPISVKALFLEADQPAAKKARLRREEQARRERAAAAKDKAAEEAAFGKKANEVVKYATAHGGALTQGLLNNRFDGMDLGRLTKWIARNKAALGLEIWCLTATDLWLHSPLRNAGGAGVFLLVQV